MSEVAATMPERVSKRLRRPEAQPVSFAELVWAHHQRQTALVDGKLYKGEEERRYRDFLRRFEAENGRIVASYWCKDGASASALTVRHVGRLHRIFGGEDLVRLHRATDWATKDVTEVAEQLQGCETLAIRVSECLQGTSQRVAMQRLHSCVAYLLGFVDGVVRRGEEETQRTVEFVRDDLRKIERYYRGSGERAAQLVYMAGMLAGLAPILAIGVLVWLSGWLDVSNASGRTGFACATAGALGALVSVMSRLATGKLDVDYEFGKDTVRRFGMLRPWLGALLGLAMYFALESEVFGIELSGQENEETQYHFFVLFAFLAGFSERFAQDVLFSVTGRVAPPREPGAGALDVSEHLPPPPPGGDGAGAGEVVTVVERKERRETRPKPRD